MSGYVQAETTTILESHRSEIERIAGFEIEFNVIGATVSIRRKGAAAFSGRIAGFTLSAMPGCCGVTVSTGAWVHKSQQRKGLNTLLNKVREELAIAGQHGLIICTTIAKNIGENKTLEKNNWVKVRRFTNPKTHRDLFLWIKKLN